MSDGRGGGGEEIFFLRSEDLDCPYDQMVQIKSDCRRVALYIYEIYIMFYLLAVSVFVHLLLFLKYSFGY